MSNEGLIASPVKLFRLGSIVTIRGPWFSLGIHVDFQHRYVDIHFIWWIISVGNVTADWETVPEFENE